MREGLVELDRWLEDRIRTGLADPSLARYATWDDLAARLVDARAGALANRIRRLAGLVGSDPDWHARVLAEIGVLHLLAQAGQRLPDLPGALADSVATATGWQVRQADVLAGVPDTDHWIVAGRSDTREDRIEVRRTWLRGATSGRWAMVLSFAAYRQSLDTSLTVGTSVHADLHRYPGPALRALVGERFGDPQPLAAPPASSIVDACDDDRWRGRARTVARAISRDRARGADPARRSLGAHRRHRSTPAGRNPTCAGDGARRDRRRTRPAHDRVDSARRDPAHGPRRRSGARRRTRRRSIVRRGRMNIIAFPGHAGRCWPLLGWRLVARIGAMVDQ